MSVRIKQIVAAALSSVALAPVANAQIATSGPLGDVNPWGVGWIGHSENALPADFWGDSRKTDLTPLFRSINPDRLSPAELKLLTRVLMSSSKAPEGDSDQMIRQRVRLLNTIGAEDKILDLYRRFQSADWTRPVIEIEVDQDLTSGDYQRACAQVDAATEIEEFWLRARIACRVLAGQYQDAQLAADLARTDGLDDPWLFSVVASLGDETDARPPARFETGVATAISLETDLVPPVNAFNTVSPFRAAKVAQRQDAPESVRIMAAKRAATGGGLSASEERAALLPKQEPVAEAGPDAEADLTRDGFAPPTPLQRAVETVGSPEATMHEKAQALATALKASQRDPRTFKLHARVLTQELKSIPKEYDTISFAPVFVRGLISAGEIERARSWRAAMDVDQRPPPPPPPSPVAPPTDGTASTGEGALAVVPEPAPTPTTLLQLPEITFTDDTKAQLDALFVMSDDQISQDKGRAAAIALAGGVNKRESQRLLYLLNGLGVALPAESRHWLASQRRANKTTWTPVAEAAMQMQMAADAGATGEAMMHAIHVLRMDREGQRDAVSVSRALKFLNQNGQSDIAREAALEAAGLWRLN